MKANIYDVVGYGRCGGITRRGKPPPYFIERIKGDPNTDIIDVYQALDMFLPGLFAYRSILKGGMPMDIPNLRDKAVRELWHSPKEKASKHKNATGSFMSRWHLQ